MKTRLVAVILIIALAMTASVVMSAVRGRGVAKPMQPRPGMCGCMGMGFHGIMHQLNLTPDQKKQVQQLHQDYLDSTKATREELKVEMKTMIGLWTVDQPDADAIKAQAAKIDVLKDELRDTGIDFMIRGLNILTPDQRAKLRTLVQKMADRCLSGKGGCGCGAMMGGHGMGMGGMCACPMQ